MVPAKMASNTTVLTACLLGIVSVRSPARGPQFAAKPRQVYCIGMFPLLLATRIDWAREAVAAGAVIQVCLKLPGPVSNTHRL